MGLSCAIVDDHDLARLSLEAAVVAAGHTVAVSTGDPREAVRACTSMEAQVLIVDLGLGAVTGDVVARAARARRPDLPVVVASSCSEPRLIGVPALVCGVRYVAKAHIRTLLAAAIAEAYAAPCGDPHPRFAVPRTALSNQAAEVLRMVAAGYSNSEIADMRGVSRGAVERAVNRLATHAGLTGSSMHRRVGLTRVWARAAGEAAAEATRVAS